MRRSLSAVMMVTSMTVTPVPTPVAPRSVVMGAYAKVSPLTLRDMRSVMMEMGW